MIAGAEAVCADGGYDLLVLTSPSPATRAETVAGPIGLDRRVDGLIFVEGALAPGDLVEFDRLSVGVVTVGQRTDEFPSISIDNVAIGRTAVDHLVALGHTRIGILAGQAEDPLHFDVPGQRIDGARQALAQTLTLPFTEHDQLVPAGLYEVALRATESDATTAGPTRSAEIDSSASAPRDAGHAPGGA